MSDVFDTCEGNFLKNIRFVQRALQEAKSGPRQEEISEAIAEAAQEVPATRCSSIGWKSRVGCASSRK